MRQPPFGDVDEEVVTRAVDGDFKAGAKVAEEAVDAATTCKGAVNRVNAPPLFASLMLRKAMREVGGDWIEGIVFLTFLNVGERSMMMGCVVSGRSTQPLEVGAAGRIFGPVHT